MDVIPCLCLLRSFAIVAQRRRNPQLSENVSCQGLNMHSITQGSARINGDASFEIIGGNITYQNLI